MLLNRPVVLTLPHCAQLDTPTPDWTLTLKTQTHQGAWEVRQRSDQDQLMVSIAVAALLNPTLSWTLNFFQEVLTVGEETLSSPCYLQLEEECCHVLMEQLGTYGLVGQSCPPKPACKRLQLALFAPRAPCLSLDYSLRIYCIHDTPHAFKVLLVFLSVSFVRMSVDVLIFLCSLISWPIVLFSILSVGFPFYFFQAAYFIKTVHQWIVSKS